MAQNDSPVISVRIPIDSALLSDRNQTRLRQILGRDTRVIRAFLGVIEQNERALLRTNGTRVDENRLHSITMTALRVGNGREQRTEVAHDLKTRFPRISPTEISECRMTAVSIYESYLSLRQKSSRHSRPSHESHSGRIPRRAFIPYRAKLLVDTTRKPTASIELRDSLDSAPQGRKVHDRLLIPLKVAPFHLNQLNRGRPKAVQVFVDSHRKWWVSIAIRLDVKRPQESTDTEKAVLGIDLGVNRAACTTLLTQNRVSETRYFYQKDKAELLQKCDDEAADLRREMDSRRNSGLEHDRLATKLRALGSRRADIAREYDRALVRSLIDYISELSERYLLYISVGRLKGIRNAARKGNWKGRRYRGMVHKWSYARLTESLMHGLEQLGWKAKGPDSRFRQVSERYTSVTCWKCGRRGIRPKQSLFICPTCGFRTNADRNGSLNIARRLITLIPSLQDERGLGRWMLPERAPAPKTARDSSPKQRPSLPHNGPASDRGESAVIHYAQVSLPDFGDKVEQSDHDHAVEKAVERLTAAGQDAASVKQEKEVRTAGGARSR